MRIGTNPEKEKFQKIQYKLHRVIIPVYIPNDSHDYFKNLDIVFYASINSLLKTIDAKQTNITIINNNSTKEVTEFIDNLLCKGLIDKHVKYHWNYGKVYSILQEARASYEDFITIADADVFFFNDWQNQVHRVFNEFNKVGVVGLTPDPHMAFYCNSSLIFSKFLAIKKGKIVDNYDLELFEEGINNKYFFVNNNNNWKNKQYYLEKSDLKVVIGASHFASTYRKEVFNKLKIDKPIFVFPGGELNFLDLPIDKLGFYRVSLSRAYAYHMGNSFKQELMNYKTESSNIRCFNNKKNNFFLSNLGLLYSFKTMFARTVKFCFTQIIK